MHLYPHRTRGWSIIGRAKTITIDIIIVTVVLTRKWVAQRKEGLIMVGLKPCSSFPSLFVTLKNLDYYCDDDQNRH